MTDEGADRLIPSFLSRSRRKVQLVSCHSKERLPISQSLFGSGYAGLGCARAEGVLYSTWHALTRIFPYDTVREPKVRV